LLIADRYNRQKTFAYCSGNSAPEYKNAILTAVMD